MIHIISILIVIIIVVVVVVAVVVVVVVTLWGGPSWRSWTPTRTTTSPRPIPYYTTLYCNMI